MIHRKRGVKIKNLWYDGPALDDHRGRRSRHGGKHAGLWRIRRDPRDRREVFFEDLSGRWHALRWNGLPPEGEVPAFSDARVDELLVEAARRGLAPRDDRDLLPVLLDLLGEHVPVEQWPERRAEKAAGKRGRAGQAREEQRAQAADRDRHRPRQGIEPIRDTAAEVVPLQRARQVRSAVDADRRRRRERAVPSPMKPPGLLGTGDRERDPFLLPSPDDDGEPDE